MTDAHAKYELVKTTLANDLTATVAATCEKHGVSINSYYRIKREENNGKHVKTKAKAKAKPLTQAQTIMLPTEATPPVTRGKTMVIIADSREIANLLRGVLH